jgi:hypothetical protein
MYGAPYYADTVGTWHFKARVYDDYWGTIDRDARDTVVIE